MNPYHEPAGSPIGGEFASASGGGAAGGSEKSLRAKANYAATNQREQALADRSEKRLSEALGVPRTKDNSAFDLRNSKVGIEVKTFISTKNDKITMHADAMARKVAEAKRDHLKMYTVVADRRSGTTRYYVAARVGSLRLGSMTAVTLPQLKALIGR